VYFDDRIILVVEIKESDVKPHFALGEDKKWRPYIRINDKSIFVGKTFINVLKRANWETGVLLNYPVKEKYLLEYLQKNERITAKEYSLIVNLSQYRSNQILVNLALSGIIKIHITEKEEFYTAS
ncbi:MAG: ATP-binding protein, partial [Daejeonella sp.]